MFSVCFCFCFSHSPNYPDKYIICRLTQGRAEDQATCSYLYHLLGEKPSAAQHPGSVTHFCQFSFSQWVKFNQYFVSEGLVIPQRKITGMKI